MEVVTDWTDPAFAGRPVPSPDAVGSAYFAAMDRGELLFQECPDCGRRQLYPRSICAGCGGSPTWSASAGRGIVHTYTIVRQSLTPPFSRLAPYVVAIVELDEGPRLMGNVTDCDPETVWIGMPVEAYAVRVEHGLAVPFWRPVAS
jgi:uncharacterized protein